MAWDLSSYGDRAEDQWEMRSARGRATKITLQSLLGTWRLREINPLAAVVDLLASLNAEQLLALLV